MVGVIEKTAAKIAFGERLREAIAVAEYKSDAAFARHLGVSKNRMSNFVNGWRWPEPELLGVICTELQTTADWLLYGRDDGLSLAFSRRLDAYRAAPRESGRKET